MDVHAKVTNHVDFRGAPGGNGAEAKASQRTLSVHIASGDALDVRKFVVEERISKLFEIKLVVLSESSNIDFDEIVGQPASFQMQTGSAALTSVRFWTGICKHMQQINASEGGASTYELTIVPTLWLTTQRRNHRMFQQISELEIAKKLLSEWNIEPDLKITAEYKKRKYRVQYAESDYAFFCRMLEDAGISFYFEQTDTETKLVLSDAPQSNETRPRSLPFRDNPMSSEHEYVTHVRIGQQVRPGRYTLRDHDTRLAASYPLLASAEAPNAGLEARLERFHYTPGAFLFGGDTGEGTPHADDRGKTRTDEKEGGNVAKKRLDAKRANAKVCTFETRAPDLAPGVVVSFKDHPRSDLAPEKPLLIVASTQHGGSDAAWTHECEARRGDLPFRPALSTPKPKVSGVESATVVGSPGDEIHTDEFGRVRVHFHWDRESEMNHLSSCWVPVSQSWGGAGYGGSNLPRVGQEVLVDFLGGDPDRPVVVGRLYTNMQKTPYKLPDNKTQSGWKSCSTNKTGGYNEIMFEDASGIELLRMQAEKDLHKLVKNDEAVIVGHDRTKLVKNDDAFTVGNDRTKIVQNDEDVTIGNDRTKLVKNDDNLTVGNNRTKLIQMCSREVVGQNRTRSVGINESVNVGAQHTLSVGADQSIDIGGNHSTSVGASHSTDVGAAHALTVALASAETVGAVKALTVGGAYQVSVGGMMNTTVMGMQAEEVGLTKTVTAGVSISFVCGKAKITMEASGKITLDTGGSKIVLDPKDLSASSSGEGTVFIQGGPNVQINPGS